MNYVYVLRLQDDCWYVGTTGDIVKRLRDHFVKRSGGSVWTRLHKPISCFLVWRYESDEAAKEAERQLTVGLRGLHGDEFVRGSAWTAR